MKVPQYSPAWPHSDLREIFPNIFFVMGTNITTHEGVELQHSCTMVVVKNGNELTLINTLRLNEKGLAALDDLGKVTNVVKIGAFHGRHDAFYLDRYSAKLWSLEGENRLVANGPMPFPDFSVFVFETSSQPEAIIHINRHDGILVTCDSVKNWTVADEYFSEATGQLYEKLGFLGEATISKIWQHACQVQAKDFERLKHLAFKHLISAHGAPLMDHADEKLAATIKREFGV